MHKSDQYRWIPGLVMVLILAMSGVILLGISRLENNLTERTGRDLQGMAMEIADKLDLLFTARYGDLQMIGALLPEVGDETERVKWTRQLRKLQEAYPIYAWIGLLDRTGGIVASTDPDTIGRKAGNMVRPTPLAGMSAIRVHDIQRDDLLKDQHTIGFSIPVTVPSSTEGSITFHGYVMTRITIAELTSIVTRTLRASSARTDFWNTVEYQLIDKRGDIIMESLDDTHKKPNLLSLGVESAKLIAQGQTGFTVETHARRSVEVLTGYASMPPRQELKSLDWGILVRLDTDTALQPIHQAVQSASYWAAGIVLPMLVFLFWTLHRLHMEWCQTEVAKQASQESTQLLQTILDDALDGHLLVDQNGLIIGWNPKATTIFGWSTEEAIGRRLVDLTRFPDHQPGTRQHLKEVLEAGLGKMRQQRVECNCLDKDGRSFPVEMSMVALKKTSGFLYSIFARDITDQKQKERFRAVEHQIHELLLEAPSFETVNEGIMRSICEMLGWQLSVLWTVDQEAGVLRYTKHWTRAQEQFEAFLERKKQLNFTVGVGLPGKAWQSGNVEWIPDLTCDKNFPQTALATQLGLHAAFAFPIKLENDVHAVMEFFSEAIQPPDQQVLDLFDNIARQLSQSLMRRMAERNLIRSEARFSGILQLAKDAIISVDHSQQIILFNHGAERIFGYTAEEMLGQPLELLIPYGLGEGDRSDLREDGLNQISPQSIASRREVVGVRKGGEKFPAEASFAHVTVEGQTSYTTILRDISLHKQEEEVLREAKMQAEQAADAKKMLLAAVEVFFIRLTASNIVCEWTTFAEKLFDIPLAEAMGRTFQDLPIAWDWDMVTEASSQAIRKATTVHLGNVRVHTPGDQQRSLKLIISPVFKDSGLGVVLMGEDITERLLLEQDLVQVHKLEAIGQLAAGIAHEINTPTQFVGDNIRFLGDSFTEILPILDQHQALLSAAKAEACLPDRIAQCEAETRKVDLGYLVEEIPKAIAQTEEGIERIATIVRAMKEFAHPGSEEKAYIDLNKAIESTVTVSRNEWKYIADLKTDLMPDLPLVFCLLGPINQMIVNMIVNAAHAINDVVKNTGKKGQITIATRLVEEWIEIRIADTGMGIPEAIRQKIFDPFFTTKPVGKGTGQGLAIARSVVVDKHGGSIAVESEVGQGTTFIIRLPGKIDGGQQQKEKAA